jgi:hypothetical protein
VPTAAASGRFGSLAIAIRPLLLDQRSRLSRTLIAGAFVRYRQRDRRAGWLLL